MHPIVYYIIFFLAIGALGMALGSRKTTSAVRRQRWLKYFTYILFTGIVVLSIFYHFFPWVALAISPASLAELIKVNYKMKPGMWYTIASTFILLTVAGGFVFYAYTFGPSFFLFIYMQVMVFDGFCQITGQIFGRHLLAPSISPSKTVEGLAGGWLCCIGTALSAANWVHVSLSEALIFGFGTGLFCFCGDMLASWYKRIVKVKDYSNWLPGQGGFLDRFDSLLFTGAIYLLLDETILKNYLKEFTR